jgi:hypothetical protein
MSADLTNLETASILKIKKLLDERFGLGVWRKFEPETILLDLGLEESALMVDKLCLLNIMAYTPSLVYKDPILFLHACSVINNDPADFDSVPHITMLEAAYALHSINKVMLSDRVTPVYPDALIKTCSYILRNDGCSEPIEPFTFIPKNELESGQTDKDTQDKKKALAMYLIHMDSL